MVANRDETATSSAPAATAGDDGVRTAFAILDQANEIAQATDPREQLLRQWRDGLERRIGLVLEHDAKIRRSWLSRIAPPNGKNIRRALELVRDTFQNSEANFKKLKPSSDALASSDTVARDLAWFAIRWRSGNAVDWISDLRSKLKSARDEIGNSRSIPPVESLTLPALLVAWVVIDSLDRDSEVEPQVWDHLRKLINLWLKASNWTACLVREADAETADFTDAAEEIQVASDVAVHTGCVERTGLVVFDRVNRAARMVVRKGRRSSHTPDVAKLVVELVGMLGAARRADAAPGAWILSADELTRFDATASRLWANRDLITGLRTLDPKWPGWSHWEELAATLKVKGSPEALLETILPTLEDRAAEDNCWSAAYRHLGKSLREFAAGSATTLELAATIQRPRKLYVKDGMSSGVQDYPERDENGYRFTKESVGPDWPTGKPGEEALEWVSAGLPVPPCPEAFPSLRNWYDALPDLPKRPEEVRSRLEAARVAFRRQAEAEPEAFHRFVQEAFVNDQSPSARWLELLRRREWIELLIPEPLGGGRCRLPEVKKLHELAPENVSFIEAPQDVLTGLVSDGPFRFAPSARLATMKVYVSAEALKRCESARQLLLSVREVSRQRKARGDSNGSWHDHIEPPARAAFLAALERGVGRENPDDVAAFARRNALEMIRATSPAIAHHPDRTVRQLIENVRSYTELFGFYLLPEKKCFIGDTCEITKNCEITNDNGQKLCDIETIFDQANTKGRTWLIELGLCQQQGNDRELVEGQRARGCHSAGEAPRGWQDLKALVDPAKGDWADRIREEMQLWPEQWMTGELRRRKPRIQELFSRVWENPGGDGMDAEVIHQIRAAVFRIVEWKFESSERIDFYLGEPLGHRSKEEYETVGPPSANYFVRHMVRPGLRVKGDVWVKAEIER